MRLSKWNDGYVFDTDPRREDPLYYYVQEGYWGSALGFEVAPLCEERTATEVDIRVFPGHEGQEASMKPDQRSEMYRRAITVLLERFPTWSQVTLRSAHLPLLMADGLLPAIFTASGFTRFTKVTPNEIIWRKA